MTARAVALLAVVLGSFAAMTAVGAVLTDGKAETSLTLSGVLVPAAIPVLLVIGVTVACRRQSVRPTMTSSDLPIPRS